MIEDMPLRHNTTTLFVPSCGKSIEHSEQFELYYCPATRPARQAEYLGLYANKTVRAIGRIAKVMTCRVDLSVSQVYAEGPQILSADEVNRILGASRGALELGWDRSETRMFFLCDELAKTDFRKDSPHGMRGRRYFDLEHVLGLSVPGDLVELAARLSKCTWK